MAFRDICTTYPIEACLAKDAILRIPMQQYVMEQALESRGMGSRYGVKFGYLYTCGSNNRVLIIYKVNSILTLSA